MIAAEQRQAHATDGQVDAVEQDEDGDEQVDDIQGGNGPDDYADGPGQGAVFHLGGQQATDHPGQEQAQADADAVIGPVEVTCDSQGQPQEHDGDDGAD